MNISLGSTNLAKYAKATALTVYLMTGVKAAVRPVFNLRDKKSDEQSRKYSAMNELLYQIVCLGFAIAMIPLFEKGGYKLAEKGLKKIKGLENITKYNQIPEFKNITKLKEFKKDYLTKSFDEEFLKRVKADEETELADKAMHHINGGVEAGSLLGSIIGLTILAPKIGHEILHPIMHSIGMDKKDNNIGKPTEIFLADAKVPTEKPSRLNANA